MKEKIQFHASEEKLCILYNYYMSYEEKGGFDIDQKGSKTHRKMIHKQPNQASKQGNKNTKTTRVTNPLILVNSSFFISTPQR